MGGFVPLDLFGIPIKGGITEGGLLLILLGAISLGIIVVVIIFTAKRMLLRPIMEVLDRVGEVKDQVKNDHDKPLRDDVDEKHDELKQGMTALLTASQRHDGALAALSERVTGVDRRISSVDERIGNFLTKEEIDARIDDRTLPRPPRQRRKPSTKE